MSHLLEQLLVFTYLSVGVEKLLIDRTCRNFLREIEQSISGALSWATLTLNFALLSRTCGD